MRIKNFQYLCIVAMVCSSSPQCLAAVFYGTNVARILTDINHELSDVAVSFDREISIGSLTIQTDLDAGVHNSTTINAMWTGSSSLSPYTHSVVNPLTFSTDNFTVNVEFTSFTSTAYFEGGSFASDGFGGLELTPTVATGSAIYSGNYTITGPTSTVTSSFTVSSGIVDFTNSKKLNFSNIDFPNDLDFSVSAGGLRYFTSNSNILQETVDGQDIGVNLSTGSVLASGLRGNLVAIPEPSAPLLIVVSCFPLLLNRRKK